MPFVVGWATTKSLQKTDFDRSRVIFSLNDAVERWTDSPSKIKQFALCSLAGFSAATIFFAKGSQITIRDGLRLIRAGGAHLYGPSYQMSCCFRARYSFLATIYAVNAGVSVAGTTMFGGLSGLSGWLFLKAQAAEKLDDDDEQSS